MSNKRFTVRRTLTGKYVLMVLMQSQYNKEVWVPRAMGYSDLPEFFDRLRRGEETFTEST